MPQPKSCCRMCRASPMSAQLLAVRALQEPDTASTKLRYQRRRAHSRGGHLPRRTSRGTRRTLLKQFLMASAKMKRHLAPEANTKCSRASGKQRRNRTPRSSHCIKNLERYPEARRLRLADIQPAPKRSRQVENLNSK